MILLYEERAAWVRTCTHTIVTDRDPDYARFCNDATGATAHLLRVWLARLEGREARPVAYLGSLSLCPDTRLFRQLRRLFGRLRQETRAASAELTTQLRGQLRAHIRRQAAGLSPPAGGPRRPGRRPSP